MRKEKSLEHISDGQLYDINSMVKVETDGCKGCSACCHDVGDLVELNPFDVYEMKKGTGLSFEALEKDKLELHIPDKIALPFLKMEEGSRRCAFLNEEDRCSIHNNRPSICRLFPLGRVYEKDGFKYFLQVDACVKPSLRKAKVKKWLGIDNYGDNKKFILVWHDFIKALTFRMKFIRDEQELKDMNALMKDLFFRQGPADGDYFYDWFSSQVVIGKEKFGLL